MARQAVRVPVAAGQIELADRLRAADARSRRASGDCAAHYIARLSRRQHGRKEEDQEGGREAVSEEVGAEEEHEASRAEEAREEGGTPTGGPKERETVPAAKSAAGVVYADVRRTLSSGLIGRLLGS